MITLFDFQYKAVKKMKNGCILCGDVGSGKSRTGLAYYYQLFGGSMEVIGSYKDKQDRTVLQLKPSKMNKPKKLIILTTAKKRDSNEWNEELAIYGMSSISESNDYDNEIIIDSWNNIKKYINTKDAFFIFDEDRVYGKGSWAKAFIKIAKSNQWVLLSASPGDNWVDYRAVFIANGFYKNMTEFNNNHLIIDYSGKFPKITRYLNTGRLIRLRNNILVDIDFERPTVSHNVSIYCDYDSKLYKDVIRNRWNYEKEKPIENASEFCYELRKIVNSNPTRLIEVLNIYEKKNRVIIFYNFDYELELLIKLCEDSEIPYAQWNGHKHQDIPSTDNWIYLVNYTGGAEGWNCIKTDTIIFYSQSYSYKTVLQACGRINRLNTPYKELYYFHLKSRSGIDLAIGKALTTKKKFNESRFNSKEESKRIT